MKNRIETKDKIVNDIVNIINTAQVNALRAVNTELIKRNWLIGKRINDEILTNRSNDYGKKLIKNLSLELSKYGKGFTRINLYYYLKFYKLYPKIVHTVREQSQSPNILHTVCTQSFLPWSHYRLLIQIEDKKERDWYETEATNICWSYRDLERNIRTDYYHRVLSNQIDNKSNQLVSINSNDYFKSLYVFDFIKFKKNNQMKEYDLEQGLMNNLSKFLLELGKGYSFVGRQVHLRSQNKDFYIDLVFYNSILKSNILIDLKINKIEHKDIGQMLIYLDLFDKQYKQSNDNPSIGMILSSDCDNVIVKYLMQNTHNNIVPSKYLTYLPTKQELKKEISKLNINKK